MKSKGSKEEVWDGIASHTAGGKTKGALMVNKWGKVVFKSRHNAAKRTGAGDNLIPYRKKSVRKSSRRKSSRRKSSRRKSSRRKSSRRKSSRRKSSRPCVAGNGRIVSRKRGNVNCPDGANVVRKSSRRKSSRKKSARRNPRSYLYSKNR